MKLSTSTTAAVLAALAFVQGATAVDFDFREFEGWWEGAGVNRGKTPAISVYGSNVSPNDYNANFKCKATGDFRKAMCEYTWVVQSDEACYVAYDPAAELNGVPNPGRNIPPALGHPQFDANNHNTGIVKCQFMLDQLDADTGKVDELMCDIECCGSTGCSDYPWLFVSLLYNDNPRVGTDPSLSEIPNPDLPNAFGPQLLVNLSMEAGKSNNHVKAIKVKQRPMVSETGEAYIRGDEKPFFVSHYLRRIAGGFKEL